MLRIALFYLTLAVTLGFPPIAVITVPIMLFCLYRARRGLQDAFALKAFLDGQEADRQALTDAKKIKGMFL